jgi:hypothetical protein
MTANDFRTSAQLVNEQEHVKHIPKELMERMYAAKAQGSYAIRVAIDDLPFEVEFALGRLGFKVKDVPNFVQVRVFLWKEWMEGEATHKIVSWY